MKVHYGAMITVTGSLDLGKEKRKLTISELAQVHNVIQKAIRDTTQASLKDLTISVSKVVILNLESDD